MKLSKASGIVVALVLSLSAVQVHAEPRYFARAPIAAWQGERFTVVRISTMNWFDAQRAMIENATKTFPGDVVALQAAIRANPGLTRALASHGARAGNVVAIQQAFNGNLVFYLN